MCNCYRIHVLYCKWHSKFDVRNSPGIVANRKMLLWCKRRPECIDSKFTSINTYNTSERRGWAEVSRLRKALYNLRVYLMRRYVLNCRNEEPISKGVIHGFFCKLKVIIRICVKRYRHFQIIVDVN